MKKLVLNLQNIEGTEVLTRAQLKNVLAGAGFSCSCNKPVIHDGKLLVGWGADYSSVQELMKGINSYCGNIGGTCMAITTIPPTKPQPLSFT